jgi:hypothetical protein
MLFPEVFMRRFLSCLVLLMIALFPLQSWADAEPPLITADETLTRSFTGPIDRIDVHVFNGSIDISAMPGNSVNAEVTKRGAGRDLAEARADLANIQITLLQKDGCLTVIASRTDKQSKPNSGALAKLMVPAQAALALQTSNAKITVIGPVGKTDAQSSNGAIRVQQAAGGVKLCTSNASIDVQAVTGALDLQTSNGTISILGIPGTLSAQTSNGEINFAGKLGSGCNRFETSNGDVELKFPADFNFKIDAETSNGSVDSEFPVSNPSEAEPTSLKTSIGAPSKVMVMVRTDNACIHLKYLSSK